MKYLSRVSVFLLSVSISGCFQTGNESDIVNVPIQMNGTVAAGLAECQVTAYSPSGEAVSDTWTGAETPVKSDGTPTEGKFSLTIENYAGVAFIEATDCTYVDEATDKVMSGQTLTAGIVIPELEEDDMSDGEPQVTVVVSPLTSLAVKSSENETDSREDIDADMIRRSNEMISETLFDSDVDILTTVPAISTDAAAQDADKSAQDYGLYLAAISGAGDLPDVIEALADGIDIEEEGLDEDAEELLVEGAIAFEASGHKKVERDTVAMVGYAKTQKRAAGTAPVISFTHLTGTSAPAEDSAFTSSNRKLTVRKNTFFSIDDLITVEDADNDLKSVSVRFLPDGVSAINRGRGIEGRLSKAGSRAIVFVAEDRAGHKSSISISIGILDETEDGADSKEKSGSAATAKEPSSVAMSKPTTDKPLRPASSAPTVDREADTSSEAGAKPETEAEPEAEAPSAASSSEVMIEGVVAAGLSECRVVARDRNNRVVSTRWVGRSSPVRADGTMTDGRYELTLTDHTGLTFIEARDCTYIDETSNEQVTGARMSAIAIIPAGDKSGTLTVHLSPYTRIARDLAVAEAGSLAEMSDGVARKANRGVAEALFGDDIDITKTRPVIATDTKADTSDVASQDYGLYLAALSGRGDLDEAVRELAAEIDVDGGKLSASGEEMLSEGAAAFEASGFKAVKRDTFRALSRIRTKGKPKGSAPAISLADKTLTVTAGKKFTLKDVVSVSDEDGDTPRVRFRNLPAGVSAHETFGLTGRIAKAGRHAVVAVVRDRTGNARSRRLFLQVKEAAPAPSAPAATPPATPGASATPPAATAPEKTTRPYTMMDSPEEVVHFLMRAGFGGTKEDIDALVGTDAADWVEAQLGMPAETILGEVIVKNNTGRANYRVVSELNYDQMLGTEDHLRERMKFALSQILVVGPGPGVYTVEISNYIDILSKHAFGNYRDLLQDVTESPSMGKYLTYNTNRKADPKTGRTPDENYAREIMQLFSIGLTELNENGEPRFDSAGNEIDTYTQEDIGQLARVFTGLWIRHDPGIEFWRNPAFYRPMLLIASEHSRLQKTFLGYTIPAGTEGRASIALALDHIFNHRNVGPFIGRQLIQRFTASHPSPDYVQRVATAFNNGVFKAPGGQRFGTGRRGDLSATIAAILLDPSLFDSEILPQDGKIREPVLRLAGWAHSFDVSNIDSSDQHFLADSSAYKFRLGQHPYGSSSVFNFYRPGYIAPGTMTGANKLTAPELQLVTAVSRDSFINYMSSFAFDQTNERNKGNNTYIPDYSDLIDLVETPDLLVEHLDLYLTGNRMSSATKNRIRKVIEIYKIRESQELRDKSLIVKLAVAMSITSPAFTVIY